jgi:nucleoside-diphosphate-sugar epimerase
MKILVTGTSGFIGCRLAQMLAEGGHTVIATGRSANPVETARVARLAAVGIQVQEGSLLDAGFADTLVTGCDAVIHLAAAQHEGNVPDSYFRDVNVGGTHALIEAAVKGGVRRFVYGSTIGIYGSARDGELDENSPARPENIYGVTKYEAEQEVERHASKIEVCIARISETFGPGDFRLLKLFKAIHRGAFMMLGSGRNLRQVIYVDDLCRALLLCAQHPAAVNETFVFAGNEVMSTRDMAAQIAQSLGKAPSNLRIPIWPFRAAAAVFEATFKPLGLQPPLTQRRLDFFTKSFLFSTAKYQRLLGFKPQTAFSQGAAVTAAWYKDNGLL